MIQVHREYVVQFNASLDSERPEPQALIAQRVSELFIRANNATIKSEAAQFFNSNSINASKKDRMFGYE
jgi:hypothetical protein